MKKIAAVLALFVLPVLAVAAVKDPSVKPRLVPGLHPNCLLHPEWTVGVYYERMDLQGSVLRKDVFVCGEENALAAREQIDQHGLELSTEYISISHSGIRGFWLYETDGPTDLKK